MLILQNISYQHSNKDLLFESINFSLNRQDKIAIIGNNGSGKSTLLKIIAKELDPNGGVLKLNSEPYFIPQIFGQYNHLTIAQALKIDGKLNALLAILNGSTSEENFNMLDDDWTIEDRCKEALSYWNLSDYSLSQSMDSLSGGQKTKVFLAGIAIHGPELILLDEPSNHLDAHSRKLLYDFIQTTKSTLIIVSHDRKLLNLLSNVYELSKNGIRFYNGNYDSYLEQKQMEQNGLNQDLQVKEKELRKAREKERETIERQQKLDCRGKGKQAKSGVARIMMNTLRNNAENSTSKVKEVHNEKISSISQKLQELRSELPDIDKMKFGFDNSSLHKGKVLFKADEINFHYDAEFLWKENINFQIRSGDRIALKGLNGSGKSTLIQIILKEITPQKGSFFSAESKSVYIDQDYSLIDNELRVYEQAQKYNHASLEEHEIKMRLNRFLFNKNDWDKPCNVLSGGEKMRLILCCLTIANQSPDLIVLDEPTNNLDIKNIEILTIVIKEYQGTLIVVSHDEMFLNDVKIEKTIQLQ